MPPSGADLLTNGRSLVEAMGVWPSFHDARVQWARIEGDTCRIVIHVFRMTDPSDARGYAVLTEHHLVEIELLETTSCTLPAGYDGDILFGLTTERSEGRVNLVFDSAVDPDRSWRASCREAVVARVLPCGPRGERMA